MRTVEIIPNAITAVNLLLGILALINMFNENYIMAASMILIAALSDRFDGYIARRYNAETDFGKEFDSLADIVSFGVAPAALVYCIVSTEYAIAGIVCFCVFTLCGGLRLARYNITSDKDYFQGIPITVCGTILALMVLIAPKQQIVILLVSFLLALSMISKIRIPRI